MRKKQREMGREKEREGERIGERDVDGEGFVMWMGRGCV